MSRVKIFYAIYDPECKGYVADCFNTTDENAVKDSLLRYICPGQDEETIEELFLLSVQELAKLAGMRIEMGYVKFSSDDDVDLLEFSEDLGN